MRIASFIPKKCYVPVNDFNPIINSDKFSRSYDDLYLGVNFLLLDTR